MKRLSFIYLLFVPLLGIGQNYTTTRNYTAEKIYLDATATGSGARSVSNVVYTDGFGRKLQQIAVNAAPGGAGDIITPHVYGSFGRVEKNYLPYTRVGNNGSYYENSLASGNWNVYGATEAAYACSITEYEGGPMNHLTKHIGAGVAWQSNNKCITNTYKFNALNEVRRFWVNTSGTLLSDGYYPTGTLRKTTTTDEDGNKVETFTGSGDRLLLMASYEGSNRLETYSVYDDRGQLRYVLTPEASYQMGTSINETVLAQYAYRYDYDQRGRMVQKRLPGCDPVWMVYDAKDRLVMSQDGKQRTENANKWSYSLYDSKNRVTETGEVTLGASTNHTALQQAASASGDYTPAGTRTALQYTLYDSYTPTADVPVHAFAPSAGFASSHHTLVTGLVTSVKTRVLDSAPVQWLTSTTYYDDHGQVIQTVSDNLQGGKSRLEMAYDFTGNLTAQREAHTVGAQTDIVATAHTYDDRGRLLSTTTILNGGTPATVTLTYDAVGRLQTKKLGTTTETMTYNIRGWLTSKQSAPFTMNLRYQNPAGGATARWNGNISEWDWQHGSSAGLLYGFTYDGANRLTETFEKQKSGSSWVALTASYLEKGITYDRNGNIKTLQRTASGSAVDNLTYAYTGNQLTSLSEAVRTVPTGDIYAPGSATSASYAYDRNGNMTSDARKGLSFGYNLLNLVREVQSGGTLKARYTWLADGSKLRVRDAASNGFDYLGSLTYTGSGAGLRLEAANFGGGSIKVSGTSQEINYFLTDHLGSTRVIVDGSGVVKERNDYYAFGAKHVRSDYPQTTNRYDFNGKEDQTTGALNLLDYGARMYDPALGRWFNVDLLAEDYFDLSPFNYCTNNPILYIDPFGLDFWSTNNPGLIKQFFQEFTRTGSASTEGWTHTTDDDFMGNLSYNDKLRCYTFVDGYKEGENFVFDIYKFPQSDGYFLTFEPNGFDQLNQNFGMIGRLAYSFLNDPLVALQMLAGRSDPKELDGSITPPNEKINRGVGGVLTAAGPMLSYVAKGIGTLKNGAQFNKLFKGTGINTAKKGGGVLVKKYNHSIKTGNGAIKAGKNAINTTSILLPEINDRMY